MRMYLHMCHAGWDCCAHTHISHGEKNFIQSTSWIAHGQKWYASFFGCCMGGRVLEANTSFYIASKHMQIHLLQKKVCLHLFAHPDNFKKLNYMPNMYHQQQGNMYLDRLELSLETKKLALEKDLLKNVLENKWNICLKQPLSCLFKTMPFKNCIVKHVNCKMHVFSCRIATSAIRVLSPWVA